MAYSPIAFTAANYRDYKFNWLKAYEPGTTTPKVIATDSTLGTLIAKAQINVDGFIISAGEALITPYVDGSYDLWLFPTAAEADANDTSSAFRLADNITGSSEAIVNGDAAVTDAFIAADVVVTGAFVAADTVVTDAFIAADVVVTDAFIAADTAATIALASITGAALVGSSSGSTVQQEITALQAGQTGGVIVFATYALLDAYTPAVDEQNSSFKVTNDPTSSLNGYYSWVSGTTYTKDADLVVNVADRANTSDAVSGKAVLEATDGTATLLYDDTFLDAGLIGFIDYNNGVFSGSGSYISTDFLEIMPDTDYVFNMSLPGGGNSGAAFYDKDQVFISGFRSTSAGGAGSPGIQNFQTSPSNAKYARTGGYTPYDEEVTYVRSANGDYNIERLKEILTLYNPTINSDNVDTETVDPTQPILTGLLAEIQTQQTALAEAINVNSGLIDEITDNDSPYFVEVQTLIKTASDGGDETPLVITNRVSDTVFTVGLSDVAALPLVESACVVENNTGFDYDTFIITDINAGNGEVTIEGVLPANPTAVARMHNGVNGQHLTRLGYKAYAEHLANQGDKYNYRKSTTLFEYHPPICSSPSFSEPRAFDLTNTVVLADFVVIGGALAGGFVDGTTDLTVSRQTVSSDTNISTEPNTAPLARRYVLRQNGAGKGVSLEIPVNGADGYIKIGVACGAQSYTPTGGGSALSAGRMRIRVNDGATDIVDQLIEPNDSIVINQDFSGAAKLLVSYFCEDNDVTVGDITYIYVYNKRASQLPAPMFKKGDNIAYLCDSWGEFPLIGGVETGLERPDGSVMGGLGYISEHLRDYLAFKGVAVQTQNMSRGGQTSEWGKFWVKSIVGLATKPTHCVLHFSINDNNSMSEYVAQLPNIYDFNPSDQWAQLDSDIGGIFGAVNSEIWFANMQSMCVSLLNAGIKPIVLMPPYTGSDGQAQSIRQFFTAQVYVGFNDLYTSGGLLPNTPTL